MKKILYYILIFLIIMSGCKKSSSTANIKRNDALGIELNKDTVSAESLIKKIIEDDKYNKWEFWPGHEGFNPGLSPHGKFHKIYVNNSIFNALPIQNKIVPDQGIIVKENYNSDKKLMMLTIMAKVKDYNPEANDWFWAVYNPNDGSKDGGKIGKCIGCHAAVKNNDFVIIQALDKK